MSYGSSTKSFRIQRSLFIVPADWGIILQAVDRDDQLLTAGILFTKEEFDGYVDEKSAKKGIIFH